MRVPVCPLCERLQAGDVIVENDLAAVLPDAYPVSEGHVLIVPKRHEGSVLALSEDEQVAMLRLARRICGESADADGFTIGTNVGEAAGQTVPHAHLHVIPRYQGDVADPRGGVRWVIPEKAAYWEDGDG